MRGERLPTPEGIRKGTGGCGDGDTAHPLPSFMSGEVGAGLEGNASFGLRLLLRLK